METFQVVTTIIAGIVAVLAAAFSVVAVITLLKYKTETLERTETSLKTEIKELRDSISALTTSVKVQGAEQQVMYSMSAKIVEGFISRLDKLEEEVRKWKG